MWKIFAKDLHEMLASRRSWLALLVLPLLLIGLAGDLSVRDKALRTYIEPATGATPDATRLRGIFADLQGVSLVDEERAGRPVWSFMDEAGLDIAAVWQPTALAGSGGSWFLYIQPFYTYQDRNLSTLALLVQAGVKLDRVWWVGALADGDAARSLTLQIVKRNGTPPATSAWLVPRVIAIVVSVVAFLVASGAWVRERELGTLPLLVISPHVGWRAMFFGKLLLPLLAGIVLLALSLIFAAALYRFGLKSGMPGMLAIQALAVLAVTLQGLMVSALVVSQYQAYVAAAAYLVALLLLTGLLFPIGEGSATAQALASLFPLTFAMPALDAWLTFGVIPSLFGSQMFELTIQVMAFGLLAGLAFWRLRRRL
jgi:ABC-type transport system involved in multi-copper enzyme maturation permease subunit